MATVIGTVTNIQGMAIVVDANGNRHMLKVGEILHAGDKVITAAGAAVSVKLANGETVNFAEAQTVKITENLAQVDVSDVSENAVNQGVLDAVITALNEGRDITEVLDDPAAGEGGSDGNASFVNLERIQTDVGGAANYDGGTGVGSSAPQGSIAPNFVFLTPASGAPIIVLSGDINNDGTLNANELAGALFTNANVSLPVGLEPGDVLNVAHNSGTITVVLSAANIAAGFVNVSIPVPAEGTTLVATASITNQSGQTSPSSSDSALIDTIAPGAPIVTIETDTNNDGYINKAELGSETLAKVSVALPATAMPNDQLLVSVNGGTPIVITLSQADISKGSVSVPGIAVPANGQDLLVTAQVKDIAGNVGPTGSDLAKVDTGVPNDGAAPTVEITTDANNDGFINRAEQGNATTDDVKVSFDGGKVSIGDIVTVTDGIVTKNITIDAKAKADGYVTTTFAKPVEGGFLTVNAIISDLAGNKSDKGEDTAKLDTSALSGLTITLTTDSNDDAFINKAELTAAGNKVTAEIKLPLDAAAGDSLVVTGTGNATQTITLTQAQIDAGKVVVTFNPPANGVDLQVTAQVTDPAGNTSNIGTDHAVIATDGPGAPTVTLTTDTDNNGYINQNELNGSSTVSVLIGLPATAKAGDKLIINDGINPPTTYVLTPADITAGSYTTTVPAPASGTALTVTAQIVDVAGNPSNTGSDSATIDTTVYSGLAIEIRTDANNDGFINQAELTNNKIDVRVTVPQGAATGDTLTVTGSGNVPQTIILTADQINAGYVDVSFNPTLNGTDFLSTASIKDAAGNASGPVQDQAKLQLVAPGAPIVTIETDTNNDGYINKAELGSETLAKVSVALPATAMPNDQLLVSVNGGTPILITLSQADISKGSVSVPGIAVPANGQDLLVTAQVKDIAGNVGPTGSDLAKVDTAAPIKPSIDNIFDDFGTSKGNISSGGTADDPTPTLTGKAEAGSTVTIFDGIVKVGTATADKDGNWTFTPATEIAKGLHNYTVTATDAAGNISQPSNTYTYTLNQAPVFLTLNAISSVSEDGLVGGLLDAGPSNVIATGSMGISDPNGDLKSVTLTAPTDTYTSGGTVISWSGNNTGTLIGSANGKEVIRVTIDSKGDYAVSLSGPIDHPNAGEDNLAVKFGVNATDNSATTAGSITINVSDDAPVAANQTLNATVSAGTNIMFTIDVSGSMDTKDGVNRATRLESEIASINRLLDGYIALGGDIKVMIVTFSDNASQKTASWVTVGEAKVVLAGLTTLSGTNYDAALSGAQSAFNAGGRIVGGQNVGYFFSDGEPNRGLEIGDADRQNWEGFLKANDINQYAIGVGSGVSAAQVANSMNQIAYNGAKEIDTNAVRVSDFTQLDSVLSATLPTPIAGSLTTGGGFGADGGYVKSISVDGTNYTFDNKTGAISVNGQNNSTYNQTTHQLTVKTTVGTFVVDMDDGNYTFTPKQATVTLTNTTFNAAAQSQNTPLPAGWFTDNPSRTIEVQESTIYGLSSSYGNVLEIENYRGDGNIYTLIKPNAGDTVTLGFDYAGRANYLSGTDSAIQVIVDGKVIDTVNTRSLTMTHFTYTFAGTGNEMRVEFKSIDTNSTGGLLDNILITSTSTSNVPTSTQLGYTLSDKDGDTSSATLTLNVSKNTSVVTTPQVAPDVANAASASGLIAIPGVLNVDLLNFASRQAFAASDVNNNISNVTIAYSSLLGVVLGANLLSYSQAVATELGLKVTYTQNNGLLGLVGASGKMVVTALDGGTVDNLALNEFLSTVKVDQAVGVSALQTLNITATDSTGLQDSASASTLLSLDLLSSSNSTPILGGDSGNNVVNGTSGNDIIYGYAGNDTLNGGVGNDILRGGAGNDTLNGGDGNDILIGGKGNDTLTGGAGVDVFKWDHGDEGVAGAPARDTITDFNKAAVSQGGDVLDVRDLLQGENAGNLVNFLHFEKSGSDTIVHISSNGGFSADAHNVSGSFSSGNTTQQIVLSGVDLTTGQTSDAAIINNLLSQQKLITD
ncbi:retention module-containing protein [Methylophilus medardicus]|uniref:Retention module-containing protein n=1 Tax=Methylophilus medardicus TaxID=2588534 RepID=A0A5B8CST7_9PROT|nr:retention module-containing protein [Methylophilus medardicus]QDC44384.1 retention module-containing protein [Methylophilus medardicus]